MKRLKNLFVALALCAPLTAAAQDIAINEENFPDENFRAYLLEQDYGEDGVLTEAEIKKITSIRVSNKSISSLKGIEHFTELTTLLCYSNQLTSLDMSSNTALIYLHCYSNQLTSLDVSKNTALKSLYCYNNQLTALDVSQNTALTSLACDHNQLTTLDISSCTALESLTCDNNQLTALDVSQNTALAALACGHNQLTTLDMSSCIALESLTCDNNQLTALDVSPNTELATLRCEENRLTTLDLSKNTVLTYLNCGSNNLTTLDVSQNTELTILQCYCNKIIGEAMNSLISSLSQNTTNEVCSLYVYYGYNGENNFCTKEQVAAIKAKGWTPYYYTYSTYSYEELKYEGFDNYITIEESYFPDANFRITLFKERFGYDGIITEEEIKEITSITVSSNIISSLAGIEYFTALTSLTCSNNQLTALDVSHNTALTTLSCQINQIKGEAMDALIGSLPENTTDDIYRLRIYHSTNSNEGNICTKAQVAAAKAKGWTPQYYDGTSWLEYEGYDNESTSIALPKAETMNGIVSIYNLTGQKVTNPVKGGIYVVDGKKVVVK